MVVVMHGYESWNIKKAECQRIDAFELEKTLESPLDCKENQPVNPKGDLSWVFIGRTNAGAETQNFGHVMLRADSLEKNPDTGKDWRWDKKGKTEDDMVGWHHQLNGHEFE